MLSGTNFAKESSIGTQISSFDFEWDQQSERVIINTTNWTEPDEFYTVKPYQIILDFNQAVHVKNLLSSFPKSKAIKSVKLVENPEQKGKPRVIIALKHDMEYEIINVVGKNKTVIEIAKPARALVVTKKLTTVKKNYLSGKTIYLDAGHGGQDDGAQSITNHLEKQFNLDTAKRLERLLKNLGAKVIMSRTVDQSIEKARIVSQIEETHADIYIGIHFNWFRMRSVRGTETYYYNKNSKALAREVHFNLIDGLDQPDRGMRRKMLYTIHHSNIPAIIIEPAYLTNRIDNAKIEDPRFREKIAQALAKAIVSYFKP
jgi:N-acetylmuramoyl-L-alanine amidase